MKKTNKKLTLLTLSLMMMTAFIPNAYSSSTVETAKGVAIAKSVNGDTVRVKMNNSDQSMTINRCSASGDCKHLGASEVHWVKYLDEQKSDEYVKAAGSTAALAVPAFVVGSVVFHSVNLLKSVVTRSWVPNTTLWEIAPYAFGGATGVGTAVLGGATFDTLNPVHHYDVAEALGAALDGTQSSDEMSGTDFEEFVEDLDEGLRSAVD